MKKIIYILTLIISLTSFSQSPTFSWGKINFSGLNDIGRGVALDNIGNVIEIGTTRGYDGLDFNLQGNTLPQSPPAAEYGSYSPSYGWSDSYIAKYSPSGALLWFLKTTGGYFEIIESVDTDSQNNIILVISTRSYDAMLGTIPLPHPIGQFPNRAKGFVVKLNSDGQHLWTKPIDVNLGNYPLEIGANGIYMRQVKVDYLDNIYCLGTFYGQNMFVDNFSVTGSGVFNTNQYKEDYFMLKLSPSGNVAWLSGLKSYDTKSYSKFNINENNVIAIAGSAKAATVNIGNFTFNNPINLEQQPYFLAKIDANTGNGTWATTLSTDSGINVGGDFYVSLMTSESLIDNQGNIYICGTIPGLGETNQNFSLTFGSSTLNVPTLPSATTPQNNKYRNGFMFLAKFDAQGNKLWLKSSIDLYNYSIGLRDIKFDSNGDIIGYGEYIQPVEITNGTILPNSDCGNPETNICTEYERSQKCFLVKFDTTTNNFVWSRQAGNTFKMNWGNSTGNNLMAISNTNDIVIGGTLTQDSINFDGTIVNGYPIVGGYTDAFIAKFNNSTLGLENNSLPEVAIYPNPTTGMIKLLSDSIITEIEIYELTGKLVISEKNDAINEVDLSHLSNGLYIIRITDNEDKISIEKLIKN